MVREGMGISAGVVAMWASLAAPTAIAKRNSHVLPAGTPYAAETRAKVLGTVDLTYSDDSVTYNVCETESSEYKINGSYGITWAGTYPHVTVPVADGRELGRAAKRLHVQAQPTSNGTGGLLEGTYSITGSEPPTTAGNQGVGGSDCTSVPFSGSGDFRGLGTPTFLRGDYKDPIAGTRHLFTFEMPAVEPSPSTYVDGTGGSDSVFDEWLDEYDTVPEPPNILATEPDWNSVPVHFDINVLKQLVHRKQVQLKPLYQGTHDCSQTNATGTDNCTVHWKFSWTVTLIRTHLYKTVRAYRR